MVLDTYHFGNPDQHLHNMKPDNVLTPGKQAELADVAARLARFKPTKIAVEAVSERADLGGGKIQGFTPDALTKDPDELWLPHQLERFSRPCGCIRSNAGPMGTMRVGLISSCVM
jgi:hypothetical protein